MMKISKYETRIDKEYKIYLAEYGNYFVDGRVSYNNPDMLADFFGDTIGIRNAADEHVYIACLDTKNHIIGCFEASHGSVNSSIFPVREILQKSLLIGAVSIAISHNHPSGDYTPSVEDIKATEKLNQATEICGISLLDHIIVAANNYSYYSFLEHRNL